MSIEYDTSVGVRFTQTQWLALDMLAEDAGISRSTYIRACVFDRRPKFTSDEHKELFQLAAKNHERLGNSPGAIRLTKDQHHLLIDLAKDCKAPSYASYVRTCVLKQRPPITDSSLEIRRIRLSRFEKKPMSITELRRLGRVIQGASRVRADPKRQTITLSLTENDWEYLSEFYNWKEASE